MAHLHALPKGLELQGYRIERVLGAGGFGITYLATEAMIGRAVAIKEFLPGSIAARAADSVTVHPLVAADAETFRWGLKRFRNEARTLVSFHHPNIVQVYRFFEANGTAYLVMAYEKGASLAEVLKAQRTLAAAEISALLHPLLDGIARVHAAGFLHRDIKPANIIVREDGGPALIDFGAARQSFGEKSQSSRAIVSPGYAPFEQYTSSTEQGPWTDLYALGATLYCCVAGTRPVEAPDRVAGAPMRPAAEVARGHYEPSLLEAIDWALEVNPEDRPRVGLAEILEISKGEKK
jgi:serine/threonine protein kinase